MPADTGFPRADVENDFQRARRRQVLARLAQRLRRAPDDVNIMLPFDEVVAALGMRGERRLGLQTIRLDTIVGTVDSSRDFARRFRPTNGRVRERWERLALAQRRGEPIPPIDVYRIGDMHFVIDGHHRVSIAHATGALVVVEHFLTLALRHTFHRLGPPTSPLGTYPSGGCDRVVVFFGLIAYLLWRELSGQRRAAIWAGAVVVALAFNEGYSRAYLTLHWFTDILSGWIYGGLELVVFIVAVRFVAGPAIVSDTRSRSEEPEAISADP